MRFLLAMAATCAAASSALAGFTAITGATAVLTPGTPGNSPAVGESFSTSTSGTFLSFIGDTPADPQITGGDLNFYRYTLNGSIASLNTLLGQITYTGNYVIFYDSNLDGLNNSAADIAVSTGTFSIFAQFTGLGTAALTGSLTQTSGPANPAFRDLSYGGSPVLYTGTYIETAPFSSGIIQGTLRQNAVAPAPGAAALLGIGGLMMARRRR